MGKKNTKTLDYYDRNAEKFADGTVSVDFRETQDRFLKALAGRRILDFGCGSGRDTKYFLEAGYEVSATDGSEELCRIASAYTGIPVRKMLFQELDEKERYDGIWACASILHLSGKELKPVLQKMAQALRPDGIIYTSFKYGESEGERDGRYFRNFTPELFAEFVKDIGELTEEACWITGDVRPGREDEKWVNVMMRKAER